MNLRNRILIALCLAVAAPAQAAEAAEAAEADGLTLPCDAPAPSIQDVAKAFALDNYEQAYDLRIRVRLIANRLCARGARSVLLVMEPTGDATVLRGWPVAQLEIR